MRGFNYYREVYPRIYPVYKALVAPFPRGNETKGLAELARAAESSLFLRAESYFILSWIYNGYANDFIKSALYSKILAGRYPENLLFRASHIRNLLLLKRYNEAEEIMSSTGKTGNRFFNAQLLVFNGIVQEKKYRNYTRARELYE